MSLLKVLKCMLQDEVEMEAIQTRREEAALVAYRAQVELWTLFQWDLKQTLSGPYENTMEDILSGDKARAFMRASEIQTERKKREGYREALQIIIADFRPEAENAQIQ